MIAMRVHLFPFRTQKLSSFAPTILGGRLPGKIGNANTETSTVMWRFFLCLGTGSICFRLRCPIKSAGSRRAAFSSLYDADGDAVTQIYNVSVEGYANGRKNTDRHAIDVALMRYGDSVAAL